MKYDFPIIENIKDVHYAIKGSKEFIVVDRGPYKVINYVVVTQDTFPSVKTSDGSAADCVKSQILKSLRRECRGLIFDREGKLVSRPYHKFFNMNEREETLENNVDLNEDHIVLEKLDGSMVRPFYVGKDVRWATRMGITGVAMEAEMFVAKNPIYNVFAKSLLDNGYTPIFEWLSKDNPIVIQHSKDNLVLTGVRNMLDGNYLDYSTLINLGKNDNIPVINLAKMEDILENRDDFEGIVIRFNDGHMIKIKTEWYALRHKSRDLITREKDILKIIFNKELDDIKPYLTIEDITKLDRFSDQVWEKTRITLERLVSDYKKYNKQVSGDRKRFALEIAPNIHPIERGTIFKAWNEENWEDIIENTLYTNIKQNLGNKMNMESVRFLFGGIRWGDK